MGFKMSIVRRCVSKLYYWKKFKTNKVGCTFGEKQS